eukprot:CAMPEP_0179106178 /NCGR_PEP_ID=MMETSP0796-20121207/49351_1 /TAXON_ID=73915 /ORGANISM="Pyrodinium bahamense, Strain pbaha01" /LENGTH=38 /DNA_ID= /DNA_START= /DNA_END= /DNA_ORIENTATION=
MAPPQRKLLSCAPCVPATRWVSGECAHQCVHAIMSDQL